MLISVKEIVKCIGGRVVNADHLGIDQDSVVVGRPVPLGDSRQTDLAFFFSRAYEHELRSADPGVLVTGEPFIQPLEKAQLPFWKTAAVIACPDPSAALALLSEK